MLLTSLIYSCETCTFYKSHVNVLEWFHHRYRWRILLLKHKNSWNTGPDHYWHIDHWVMVHKYRYVGLETLLEWRIAGSQNRWSMERMLTERDLRQESRLLFKDYILFKSPWYAWDSLREQCFSSSHMKKAIVRVLAHLVEHVFCRKNLSVWL